MEAWCDFAILKGLSNLFLLCDGAPLGLATCGEVPMVLLDASCVIGFSDAGQRRIPKCHNHEFLTHLLPNRFHSGLSLTRVTVANILGGACSL